MKSSITRREIFNAAHRLYSPHLTDEENLAIYGKCSYPNYHGHNYELHTTIIGDIHPETGFVYDISDLKQIIHEEIISVYDHRNLNLDTEDFQSLNPTIENITKKCYEKIRRRISPEYEVRIRCYETIRNYSEYPT